MLLELLVKVSEGRAQPTFPDDQWRQGELNRSQVSAARRPRQTRPTQQLARILHHVVDDVAPLLRRLPQLRDGEGRHGRWAEGCPHSAIRVRGHPRLHVLGQKGIQLALARPLLDTLPPWQVVILLWFQLKQRSAFRRSVPFFQHVGATREFLKHLLSEIVREAFDADDLPRLVAPFLLKHGQHFAADQLLGLVDGPQSQSLQSQIVSRHHRILERDADERRS
mmetsp:Transcript_100853/g.308350  ORF Transcript_100853/g.308350 Transcript_100853/m.308350 type:complete len:223 (-) Transcript_100853:380-1048(-)